MQVEFQVTLRIGQQGYRGLNMSDWADDTIRKLRQKIDDKRLQTERFVEEQKIKRAYGVPLWKELKDMLRFYATELKDRSGGADVIAIQHEQVDDMTLRDALGGGTLLRVAFDSGRGVVSWECGPEPQRGWEVAVAETGGAQFHCGMVPTTTDSMARQMLDKLLGI